MRYSLVLLAITALLFSCSKEKDFKKAVVINSNNLSPNGCGYILRLEDGTEEKPQYLPSAYQHDGMKVKVKASGAGSVTCATDSTTKSLTVVAIDDIKRDLD